MLMIRLGRDNRCHRTKHMSTPVSAGAALMHMCLLGYWHPSLLMYYFQSLDHVHVGHRAVQLSGTRSARLVPPPGFTRSQISRFIARRVAP